MACNSLLKKTHVFEISDVANLIPIVFQHRIYYSSNVDVQIDVAVC
jgi:hypothetical protein